MSDDREAILARRRRFIAIALAGGAAASTACSPSPCLSPDAGRPLDTSVDAPAPADAMPCLSVDAPPPHDGGEPDGGDDDAGIDDAGIDDGGVVDSGEPFDGGKPLPCLSPPPRDPRE